MNDQHNNTPNSRARPREVAGTADLKIGFIKILIKYTIIKIHRLSTVSVKANENALIAYEYFH